MSGGAFNYVSVWAGDLSELANHLGDLRDLADDLDKEFPGTQAAKDTRALVTLLGQNPHEPSRALADVWHAMEWWASSDWGRERVVEAVDAYKRPTNLQDLLSWIP